MTFTELKNRSTIFYPAIMLEKNISHTGRIRWRRISFWLLMLTFVFVFLAAYLPIDFLSENLYKFRGIFFIMFVIWFKTYLLEGFYLSYYFKDNDMDFEVARFIHTANEDDLTESFIESEIGKNTLLRLGISEEKIEQFLKENRKKLDTTDVKFDIKGTKITIKDYVLGLYESDKDFNNFIGRRNISTEQFIGALDWTTSIMWKERDEERFWRKERLIRIPSLGSNLDFEHVEAMGKYGHLIYENKIYQSIESNWEYFRKEAENLEEVLLRSSNSNVMLISSNDETGMEIVSTLGKMILLGKSLPELENKKMFVLNPEVLIKLSDSKEDFEEVFNEIMNQAALTRNMIVVIPRLEHLIEDANKAGLDIERLLVNILQNIKVSIIAITSQEGYHGSIETNVKLVKNFDKIVNNKIDTNLLQNILEDEAERIEKDKGVIFTYQVIKSISDNVMRVIGEGVTHKNIREVITKLNKVADSAVASGRKVVNIKQ